jgi:hypothetical protein
MPPPVNAGSGGLWLLRPDAILERLLRMRPPIPGDRGPVEDLDNPVGLDVGPRIRCDPGRGGLLDSASTGASRIFASCCLTRSSRDSIYNPQFSVHHSTTEICKANVNRNWAVGLLLAPEVQCLNTSADEVIRSRINLFPLITIHTDLPSLGQKE